MADKDDHENDDETLDEKKDCREEALEALRRAAVAASTRSKRKLTETKSSPAEFRKPKAEPGTKQQQQPSVIMLSFGKMTFDTSRGRGVMDRSFKILKVPLLKSYNYDECLNKVVEYVFGEKAEEMTYYLADSSGASIMSMLEVPNLSGKMVKAPWTLGTYLQLSVRFPSRARFYCVEQIASGTLQAEDLSNVICNTTPTIELEVNCTSKDEDANDEEPMLINNVEEPMLINKVNEEALQVNQNPITEKSYIDVTFIEIVPSRYRDTFVQSSGIRHTDIILRRPDIFNDLEEHKQLLINPLYFDFALEGISYEGFSVQLTNNTGECTGVTTYKFPIKGCIPDIWSGLDCRETYCLMVVIALKGYHSISSYQWFTDNEIITGEITPLYYCDKPGHYKCVVVFDKRSTSREFLIVQGNDGLLSGNEIEIEAYSHPSIDYNFIAEDKAAANQLQAASPSFLDERKLFKGKGVTLDLTLLDIIGNGSFGIVHKAIWRGMVVAAKVIRIPNYDGHSRELEAYKKVNHPYILNMIHSTVLDGSLVLITNYVPGNNLAHYIFKENFQLPLNLRLKIAINLCQALVYLHHMTPPMAHLDVKPANILINSETFHPFLADFGLARLTTASVGTMTNTAGTPIYQAPEQLKGLMPRGPCLCDVYALGCVIVELFTGKAIWPNLTPFQLIYKVTVAGELPDFSHVPVYLKSCCQATLVEEEIRENSYQLLTRLVGIDI